MSEEFKAPEKEDVDRLLGSMIELSQIAEFINDPEVDQALAMAVATVRNPNVPAHIATPMIVKLEALAFTFKMRAKWYMMTSIDKDPKKSKENSDKKNIFVSLSEQCNSLAQALKYATKLY